MKKLFHFLFSLFFLTAGCNFRTGSVSRSAELPETVKYDYIQMKIEDTECSSECHKEKVWGSDNNVCFKKNPVLTSSDIVKASSIVNPSGQGYILALELNSTGRAKLYMITKENRGKRLGIYINGKFVTAPVIYSVISDGKAAIAGGFSKNQADDIAVKLNSGKRD